MPTDIQWTRRRFVLAAAAGAGALLLPPYLRASPRRIASGGTLRIGVAGLPPDRLVGAGVELGLGEATRTAALFGWQVQLVRPADAPAGIVADLRALAAAGARVVIGTEGDAQLAEMAPVAEQLGVLLLNAAATGDSLRGCGRLLFHVAPSRAMLADAAARWLASPGKPHRVAVAAAGDAASSALAGRFERLFASLGGAVVARQALAGEGSAVPVPGDGADAVVAIGGSAAADAFIAAWNRGGVTIVDLSERAPRAVDGPAARSPAGVTVVRPTAWHESLDRFGADQLNQRYHKAFGWAMEEGAWAGWAAVKIAVEAAMRAGSGEPSAIAAHLAGGTAEFDGQKGWPLSFRAWDHQLRQPVYVVADGPDGGRVVGELPAGERGGAGDSVRALDALGAARGETICTGGAG